jgi:tetratricopeptide (TPR) repeat protein
MDIEIMSHNSNDLTSFIKLREEGRYSEAEMGLRSVVDQNSCDPEALSLLSHIYLLTHQLDKAAILLERALELGPNLLSVRKNQARLLLRQARFSDAFAITNKLIQIGSGDPEILIIHSTTLTALGQIDDALKLVEKVLSNMPDYAEAFVCRGSIFMRMNKIAEALNDYQKALMLKPHLAQLWGVIGSLALRLNNFELAVTAFGQAVELEPNKISNAVGLGDSLLKIGRKEDAIIRLRHVCDVDAENYSGWISYGMALQAAGQIDAAKQAYEKALTINPSVPEIFNNLGIIAMEQEDWKEAVRSFEKAIEKNPLKPQFWLNKSVATKRLGELEDALESVNKAIQLSNDYHQAYNNRGILYLEFERYQDALEDFNRAIDIKNDSFDAYTNRGRAYVALRNANSARADYMRAISINPSFPLAHANLGDLFYKCQEYDEALKSYEKALSLNPDNIDWQLERAETLVCLGRIDEALVACKKSMDYEPTNSKLYFFYGKYLSFQKGLTCGQASMRKAIELQIAAASKQDKKRKSLKSGYLDQLAARNTLAEVSAFFDSINVEFFLSSGTLLGVYRDGDILPYDKDMDIGILGDVPGEWLLDKINQSGLFTPARVISGRKEDYQLYISIHSRKEDVIVDIFFYKHANDRMYCGFNAISGEVRWHFSPFGLKFIDFDGHKYLIPDNTELYLKELYGQTWRIPDSGFDSVLSAPNLADGSRFVSTVFGYNRLYNQICDCNWLKALAYCRQLKPYIPDSWLAEVMNSIASNSQHLAKTGEGD